MMVLMVFSFVLLIGTNLSGWSVGCKSFAGTHRIAHADVALAPPVALDLKAARGVVKVGDLSEGCLQVFQLGCGFEAVVIPRDVRLGVQDAQQINGLLGCQAHTGRPSRRSAASAFRRSVASVSASQVYGA